MRQKYLGFTILPKYCPILTEAILHSDDVYGMTLLRIEEDKLSIKFSCLVAYNNIQLMVFPQG